MTNDDTIAREVLGWFPLCYGPWLRLSRQYHGGLDRVLLHVCVPCARDISSERLWTSPVGPMRPTAIVVSLDLATLRRVVATLRAACATPFCDATGVPLVARRVRRLRAEGQSIRAIGDAVGLSKSQVHRLLTTKQIGPKGGHLR
jgi:hypothetical protein